MKLHRLIATRVLQGAGNLLKLAFYVHLRLRPNKRYTIRPIAPPLIAVRRPQAIPRIVWLTNYTDQVTLSLYVNYLWNRCINPTYAFCFCSDEVCDAFMSQQPPETAKAYRKLRIGAAKADFWRVAVLYTFGGAYLDMDAAFSWPLALLLRPWQTELFAREKDGRLTNYFLAGAVGHPVLADILARIVANIEQNRLTSVYDMTGPTVVDDVAKSALVEVRPSREFCRQAQLTAKSLQYPEGLADHWATAQTIRSIVDAE